MRRREAIISCGALLGTAFAARSGESAPWAFNAPRGDGYLIDLVSVDPAPGTALTPGSKVTFRVTVRYQLSVTNSGYIVLVFQDEEDSSAKDNAPQAMQAVVGPAGVVTLTDTIYVPRSKELVLFVPLVPDGMKRTTGEVTIRYPLKK